MSTKNEAVAAGLAANWIGSANMADGQTLEAWREFADYCEVPGDASASSRRRHEAVRQAMADGCRVHPSRIERRGGVEYVELEID